MLLYSISKDLPAMRESSTFPPIYHIMCSTSQPTWPWHHIKNKLCPLKLGHFYLTWILANVSHDCYTWKHIFKISLNFLFVGCVHWCNISDRLPYLPGIWTQSLLFTAELILALIECHHETCILALNSISDGQWIHTVSCMNIILPVINRITRTSMTCSVCDWQVYTKLN
jgi:hypothetical protein